MEVVRYSIEVADTAAAAANTKGSATFIVRGLGMVERGGEVKITNHPGVTSTLILHLVNPSSTGLTARSGVTLHGRSTRQLNGQH